MDLITRYLQWIVIRQRKQDLVMHSQLLQTDIRTVEAQLDIKAYEVAKDCFPPISRACADVYADSLLYVKSGTINENNQGFLSSYQVSSKKCYLLLFQESLLYVSMQ